MLHLTARNYIEVVDSYLAKAFDLWYSTWVVRAAEASAYCLFELCYFWACSMSCCDASEIELNLLKRMTIFLIHYPWRKSDKYEQDFYILLLQMNSSASNFCFSYTSVVADDYRSFNRTYWLCVFCSDSVISAGTGRLVNRVHWETDVTTSSFEGGREPVHLESW